MGDDHDSKREQEASDSPEQTGNTNSESAKSTESKRSRIGLIVFLILLALAIGHMSAILLYPAFHSRLYDEVKQTDEKITKARYSIITLLADDIYNKKKDDGQKILPEGTKKNITEALVWLERVRQEINEERAKALDLKQSAYTQFWQIFSLLIVLGGSVGAVAYRLIKHDLFSIATERVNQRVDECANDLEERIDKRIRYGSLMAEARAYQGMSYTFWEHYEPNFQHALNDLKRREEYCRLAIRDVKLAKIFGNFGLKRLYETLKEIQDNKNIYAHHQGDIFYRETEIFNHLVYHYSAERVLNVVRDNPDVEPWEILKQKTGSKEFNKALKHADDVLQRCHNKSFNRRWYEFYDSIGFCLVISPHEADRQKGRKVLSDAIRGRGPIDSHFKPPYKVRLRMWEEHNERFNLQVCKPSPDS